MRTSLITPAAEYPVTTDELREHLWTIYPEKTTEEYLEGLLAAATDYLERLTRRKFMAQTHRLYLDDWPDGVILLPFGEVSAIESITWLDGAGVEHTIAQGTDYIVSLASPDPVISAGSDGWPSGQISMVDPVRINFVVGWETPGEVPGVLKQAILLLAAHWYENRETVIVGTTVRKVPYAVESLADMWKIYHPPWQQ